jgi:nucleoside-diphosphate-sugar epimerase
VVRGLLAKGHEPLVFHRGENESDDGPAQVRHLHGDRLRLADFAGEFAEFAPDVVLDMAAMTEADAQRAVEVFGGVAGRSVVISSVDVYQGFARLIGAAPAPVPVPLTEDSMPREGRLPFGGDYDKLLVEGVFQECGELPATILRLPMVHGPGDYQRRVRDILRPMRDGRDVILLDEGYRTWRVTRGYVEDVADAIVRAVDDPRAAGRTYNLGEPEPWTEGDWIRRVGAAAGWSGRVLFRPADQLPEHLAAGLEFDQDLIVDTGRIRRELGYSESTVPADAIAQTVAWEMDQSDAEVSDGKALSARKAEYAAEDALIDLSAS